MFCENCGAEIPEGSKFCNQCGASVSYEEKTAERLCPYCHEPIGEGILFCPACGYRVTQDTIPPEPPEPPEPPKPPEPPVQKYYQLKRMRFRPGMTLVGGMLYVLVLSCFGALILMENDEWWTFAEALSVFLVPFAVLVLFSFCFIISARSTQRKAEQSTDLDTGAAFEKKANQTYSRGITFLVCTPLLSLIFIMVILLLDV